MRTKLYNNNDLYLLSLLLFNLHYNERHTVINLSCRKDET
jgi:hypothetical protein